MASKKYGVDLDLQKNALLKAVLDSTNTPDTEGQIGYDSAADRIHVYAGGALKTVPKAGDIVDADIAAGAAIAKAKLGALAIVDADIDAGAAIALSKLATDPLARANHTGTQLASTISDLDTAVTAAGYVKQNAIDSAIAGIDWKDAVKLASGADLNGAYTYTAGVITGPAETALAAIDSAVPAVNDRVLFKNAGNTARNGIYKVDALGSAATAATLNQDGLTYTADTAGTGGNDISITINAGGMLAVSVTGNAITVTIDTGVTTKQQLQDEVNNHGAAGALVTVSGGSVATANTFGTANLSGGAAGTAYSLTRATDMDESAEFQKMTMVPVQNGTTNGGKWFYISATGATPVVVGTSTITFTEWQAGTTYTGTAPINVNGTTISHDDSAVVPGTYRSVTVDQKGHVSAGSNPTSISGYGLTDAASVASFDITGTGAATDTFDLAHNFNKYEVLVMARLYNEANTLANGENFDLLWSGGTDDDVNKVRVSVNNLASGKKARVMVAAIKPAA